jgi:L-malate glycosyltransferase
VRKKKILVVCPYPFNVAPSQRLKFEQYYPYFRNAGFDIKISPFISHSFWKIIYKKGHFLQKFVYTVGGYLNRMIDLLHIRRYDLIYVHLWVTPFGPPFFEWLYRRFAKKMIYDIDDLVYLNNVKSKAHPVVSMIKGRKKPIYLMKVCEHVITCTPHLDKFVRQFNCHTTDISSTVDTEKYRPANDHNAVKKLTIGWSGSHSTSKYFYLLENIFKELQKKYCFRILVIGDKGVHIDGLNIEAVDWDEVTEIYYLQQIDIGVYPLPNEEWVLGKSGLKAIQYMALGIPTAATAIGANFRVIEHGRSGFLAKNEKEWIETLEKLLSDASLRERVGTEARKRVLELFSINANKDTYLNILKQVTSG